jgi:hypothetical protein
VSVTGQGTPDAGYSYVIGFDTLSNPGNQPELQVVSTAGLKGTEAAVIFSTVNNGSFDRMYRPIPAEMLSFPVLVPSSVQVRAGAGGSSGGMAAVCL